MACRTTEVAGQRSFPWIFSQTGMRVEVAERMRTHCIRVFSFAGADTSRPQAWGLVIQVDSGRTRRNRSHNVWTREIDVEWKRDCAFAAAGFLSDPFAIELNRDAEHCCVRVDAGRRVVAEVAFRDCLFGDLADRA